MVKRLTLKDQLSREQYLERVNQYTDEDAHKLGYPSAEVLRLEIRLGEIAGTWRSTKDNMLIHEYERVLYKMILKGYNVDSLPIQDQLPDNLMPELPAKPVQMAIQSVYNSS